MSSPVTGVYFRPGGPPTRSCTANYNRLQHGSLRSGNLAGISTLTQSRSTGFSIRRGISRNARVSFASSLRLPSPSSCREWKIKNGGFFTTRDYHQSIIIISDHLLLSFLSIRNTRSCYMNEDFYGKIYVYRIFDNL